MTATKGNDPIPRRALDIYPIRATKAATEIGTAETTPKNENDITVLHAPTTAKYLVPGVRTGRIAIVNALPLPTPPRAPRDQAYPTRKDNTARNVGVPLTPPPHHSPSLLETDTIDQSRLLDGAKAALTRPTTTSGNALPPQHPKPIR